MELSIVTIDSSEKHAKKEKRVTNINKCYSLGGHSCFVGSFIHLHQKTGRL